MASVASCLKLYSASLFLGGFQGFAMSGFAPKGKTSIIFGVGSALLTFGCAQMATVTGDKPPAKGEAGYKKWMIGVHLGLLLPVLFGAMFTWRGIKAWPVEEKRYLSYLFIELDVFSAVALAAMLRFKPKKEKKDK